MSAVPDTTEAVADAVYSLHKQAACPIGDHNICIAREAVTADRKMLAAFGAVILMPGDVPPWITPVPAIEAIGGDGKPIDGIGFAVYRLSTTEGENNE